MAFQVGSACYPTAQAAAQASASGQVGSFVTTGGTSYVINASSAEDTLINYVLTPIGGGAAITVVAPYTAQPCGLLTAEDAAQLGWLLAAAWLGVYAILLLKNGVLGWGDQHGNA